MPVSTHNVESELAEYVRYAGMARNERDAALRGRWRSIARDHLRRAARLDPAAVARVSASMMRSSRGAAEVG